ncbi:MAG: triose-phosphate isomerase, partial [Negativicutes bacterium]|nr:triose-phosphate isomerase [Negativicutes bacterium]
QVLAGSNIKLAAQNVFWQEQGAYTGEVSPVMLGEVGCEYVIIGHSERRQYFGETDETVSRRIRAALKADLKPIVCVGETLAEREANQTEEVIERQIRGGLAGLSEGDMGAIVIAYEPVWAIGTGRTASSDDANAVCRFCRQLISQLFSPACAQAVRIQYGGSVKPDNAAELMAMSDIDGALVGGASLDVDGFTKIIQCR